MTAVLSGKDHPLSLIFVLKGLVEYLVSSRIDRSGVANMADRNYGPSFKERRSRRPVMNNQHSKSNHNSNDQSHVA